MSFNAFWEYFLSLESRYEVYRKRVMNAFSLSAAEVDILLFLANNPNFDTAAHIAKIRKIPKSQVSLSVANLCDMGLLTKTFRENNKKSLHLSLTEAAEPIVSLGHTVQKEFADLLFSGFTDEEKKTLLALHQKIAQNLQNERKF